MKHEVFWVSGYRWDHGLHRDADAGDLYLMALEIREAYDQAAKHGGKIIAAHTIAFQIPPRPGLEKDESEGECLFLVAEVPDDSDMGDSDTEYVDRT
jgi:hypothetical protein